MAEVRKTPAMEAEDRLKSWARSTDFATPLPWGELEARIAVDPVPAREELESLFPPRTRSRLVPYLIVAPQALLTVGASLIGLGFAAAHVLGGLNSSDVGEVVSFVFLTAIVITVLPVIIWMSTRRRETLLLIMSGGTALVSGVSFALLSTEAQIGAWSSIRTMAAVAVVTGLATSAFLLVWAKPGVSRTWAERWATPTVEDQWLRGQRALVLEVLAKRSLVNGSDIPDLMELPRGAWRQLESQPDGRVVRRHR